MPAPDRTGLPGVIYARISSEYGERADSLDNQADRCALVAARMDVPVPGGYVFKERDSGHETVDTRADLLRVRGLARSGKISTVFIHAWDRLSRTPEELVLAWKEFAAHGVQVVCLSAPTHELDVATAKLILRVQGIMGEMEWEHIRRRTSENKQNLRNRGKRVGEGGARYGYKWERREDGKIADSRGWVVDEPAAAVVRLVFDLVGNQGYTIRQVMDHLNERGIPSPSVYRGNKYKSGKSPRWTFNVRDLLVDEVYKGVATCSRTQMVRKKVAARKPRDQWQTLDNSPTPAIVDAALWQRANDALRENSGRFARAKRRAAELNRAEFSFLRGLMRCASCGANMRLAHVPQWDKATKTRTGGYKVAFKCDTRWNPTLPPGERACAGRAVYEDKVRDACWAAALAVITQTGWIESRARLVKANRPGEALLRDSLDAARAELARVARRIANVIDQLADEEDKDNRADLRDKLAALRSEKAGLGARADALAEKVRGYDTLDRRCDELVASVSRLRDGLADPDRLTWPERRAILDGLSARFRGSGETMYLEVDLGLEDVSVAEGPFAVGDNPSRSIMRRDQRICLGWNLTELLCQEAVCV